MTGDPQDSRTRILDAAELAFAEVGFAGARVAAITQAAGVNKAMLYYYFDSKEALYNAVLERIFDQVGALIEHTWRAPDPRGLDPVRACLAGYRGILEHHAAFARLMMRELADGGERVGPRLGARIGTFLPLIAGAVTKAQAEGRVNPNVHPAAVGPVIVAPMIFFALLRPILERAAGLPRDEFADTFHCTLSEVVLNGLTLPEERR